MSRKMSEARRRAFLEALRQTGNQTLAAERAKVSRSWVCLHRSTDPEFDAECDAAVGEAKAKLRSAPDQVRGDGRSNRPPAGWGYLDGAELVVKGTNGRRTQIARARLRQITPRVEDRFLAALSATCNAKASCAEAGVSSSALYAHRKRWPGFAQRWDSAVALGYSRIQRGLTANMIRLFEPPEPDAPDLELPMPKMDVDDVIRVLRIYERQEDAVRARARCPGSGRPRRRRAAGGG